MIQDHLSRHQREQSIILPVVLPVVFYNGHKQYPYSMNFFDLFGAQKEWIKLVDFNCFSDEVLRQDSWAGLLQVVMKHIFSRDLKIALEELKEVFYFIEAHDGREYLGAVLRYIAQVWQEEGRQEGRQLAKLTVARKLLLSQMSVNAVSQITELSIAQINQLKQEMQRH